MRRFQTFFRAAVGSVSVRRWLPVGLTALCLAVLPGQSALAIDADRFVDGSWFGALSGSGTVEYGSGSVNTVFNSTWHGYFNLIADSGVVTGGPWSMTGEGISHVQIGGGSNAGHATFVWSGQVGGEATAPKLGGSAVMDMRVLGQNFHVEVSRGSTHSPQLEIYTADCTQVTGDWTAGISNGIGDNGGDSNITGPFVAYNTSASEIDRDGYVDFMDNMSTFLANVFAGDFRHGELTSLIVQAESLESQMRFGPNCVGGRDFSGFYSLAVYSIVRDVIDDLFAHPGQYDTDDMLFITRSAVRAGVLGAGSLGQDYARTTEDQLMNIFDARLTQAIANNDRTEATEIMELAIEMSWQDVKEKAEQWLVG